MEGVELIAFRIISAVGTARSMYIEAIQKAKAGDFEAAEKLLKSGENMFLEGHHAHAGLLQRESSGGLYGQTQLLVLHAEDQLMSAETFKIVAREFIDAYQRIAALEKSDKPEKPEEG